MLHINTYGLPTTLEVEVEAKTPDAKLRGFAALSNTLYFDRQLPFAGKKKILLPMPLSPRKLFAEVTGGRVLSWRASPKTFVYDKEAMGGFLPFAFRFASLAGALKPGEYKSDNGKHSILYLKDIQDGGHSVETPARISMDTGQIELRIKDFKPLTVPQRVMILLHEIMHYEHDNQFDEEFCDQKAAELFVKLGFPKTEGAYAFTNVLNDTHYERVSSIINYIDSL